ncbi:hypothetical protein IC582_030465 [Cucumis melo]
MDKSWMHKSRLSKEYELGVENFIKFGFSNTSTSYIRCPCLKCGNCEKHSRKDVRDHLYVNGIDESYKIWFWHGEAFPNSSFYGECSKFDTHTCEENDVGSVKEMIEVAHEEYSKDPNGFEKLLIDAEKPLYEGCKKYTKLSTLVKLYNLKVRYGWSDISFSELLKTLKEILPTTNELPNSLYEAKKILGALGMEYEKIHACSNNCCLYRKEFANATECPKCGQSRWKNVKDRNEERKQIPSKVIWYFPPIPRFKRLFRSIECAENLTWHASERIEDGKLRHPADSPAWKLKSFIGSATHYHVPITYTPWKSVPAELKDKIFTTFEFKNWPTTKYIIPHKDEPQLLQVPPEKYSFIEQNHWEEFVRSRLSETFQFVLSLLPKKPYRIWDVWFDIWCNAPLCLSQWSCAWGWWIRYSNNVLSYLVKKTSKDEANILVENEELRRRVSELEAQIRSNLSTPLSAHGSCSRPIVLEGIEEKGKRIEVESLDKPKQKEKKGKEVMKINEPELDVLKEKDLIKMPTKKEVVCESTSTLPLALKSILRYAEKVMEKDSSITFSLPADLFGVSRKTSVLREDIVDLCNMNEVKTFTLVAYMMYLYSSVSGSKENMQYVFVDPSLISSGNTQESRIRNLCSRLMVSKPDQVVLAPFNPKGHWALLAINAYEDTVFYLDSLRTTSKATTQYCPLQVGSTTCGYYVMKYMREIVNRGSIVISDLIDT